jgi:hypothetical protein
MAWTMLLLWPGSWNDSMVWTICLSMLDSMMHICGCERLRQHAFWECAIAQAVRTQVQRGLGRALLQQGHLWLVDPPPSVYEMVWRVVVLVAIWAVLAAIWAMEQGRKRLWSLVHTPSRHGSAVKQAISKASTSFWSALHDVSRRDRPVPAKGWDGVDPDHPYLSVRIQVPLHPCLAVVLPHKH